MKERWIEREGEREGGREKSRATERQSERGKESEKKHLLDACPDFRAAEAVVVEPRPHRLPGGAPRHPID